MNYKFLFGLIIFAVAGIESSMAETASIREHNGRPTLFVAGTPVPPFAYMSYLGKEPYYREAAEAGIRLYCFPSYLGDRGINPVSGIGAFRPAMWIGENEYDFSSIAKDFDALLAADAQAQAIIRIHLDVPSWWEEKYPEGSAQMPDGTTMRQSFGSPLWREATAKTLRACLDWLEASPYREHLLGIHLAAGGTEEWFYHPRGAFSDANPTRLQNFRSWLREAYGGDIGALRVAWHNSKVDFSTARLSDMRGGDSAKAWRDPERSQAIVDTFRFHSENLVNDISYYCGVVKDHSQGRLLTGVFYGYHFFVNDPRMGHFALGKLLASPLVDYISSPNTYHRVMGEDWPPMMALGSVALHGKLFLAENDTRTFKTTLLKDQAPEICPEGYYDGGVWVGPESVEDSVALLRKNTARMLAGGYGGWWFDMWGGWFSDPRLMAVLSRTQELGRESLKSSSVNMDSQVCVIVDEELCFWDASYGDLTRGIMNNRYELGRIGTSYDLYLRSDLEAIADKQYLFVWVLGAMQLNQTELAILGAWRAQGATTLWTSPGRDLLMNSTMSSPVVLAKGKWDSAELRELMKSAGVHVYVDSEDVVYAGNGWLSVHTVEGGTREIRIPFEARLEDVFEGTVYTTVDRVVEVTLPPQTTTLYKVVELSKKGEPTDVVL